MKRIRTLALVTLAWTVGQGAAQAGDAWLLFDGCRWFMPRLCQEWQARRCCFCPDDYCAKSLPCVPPNLKGCCDDYCPKSLPCVPPNLKGCCDDYCPRCCPLWLGSLCEPWYRCVPAGCCERHH